MTIATLILTCTIFVAVGWVGDIYAPIALGVGAVVCIAAAIAGATSQDLKTGFLVGATPSSAGRPRRRRRHLGLRHRHDHALPAQVMMIGRTAASAAGDADVDDHPRAAQPEPAVGSGARRRVYLGDARAVRHPSLSFAVGTYLPIATTAPIFVGGIVRWWVERKTGKRDESEISSGTLFSSGLIAGGSLAGILYAGLFGLTSSPVLTMPLRRA